MSKQDYYDLLGVDKNADETSLKKAYRKQAMKFHPDQNPDNPDAEAKFKDINEAWEVLKDPQKRSAYDQYGHSAFDQNGGNRGFGGGNGGFGGGFGGGFEDIFGDMFGQRGGGQPTQQPGNDLRYSIDITLEEAFSGKTVDITIATALSCKKCHGSGAAEGSQKSTCSQCAGHGKVRMQQGFFAVEQTCHHCQGEGQIIQNPCGDCRGAGRKNGEKTLSANIPGGVDEGTRIRLSNEGEAGLRGAPNGDLYLFISIKPHSIFKRVDDDLYIDFPISIVTASLGKSIEVPTIDGGRVEISIPEGTQTGTKFRVRNKGMSILRSSARGNMFVQVKVETPRKLNKEQKALLQQLDGSLADKNTPDCGSIIDKIKSFWNA